MKQKNRRPERIFKGFDMTAISSDDLRKVARRLFDNEMIDIHAFVIFAEGNLASGADGLPTETDVKFNAIALFNERQGLQ